MQINPIQAQSRLSSRRRPATSEFMPQDLAAAERHLLVFEDRVPFAPVRSSERHLSAQSEFATQLAAGYGSAASALDREQHAASYAAAASAATAPSFQMSI